MPRQVRSERHVKVNGTWTYLNRVIDKDGKPLEFTLSERCDEAAAAAFS